jgi:hypothetical protein
MRAVFARADLLTQTLQRMVFAIDQAHCGPQQLSRIDINDGLVVGHEFIGYQRALEVRVPARRLRRT